MNIGHVHLKVRSLERSEEFYLKLLGAKITERLNGHYSFLSMGEAHHEIALQAIGNSAHSPTQEMVGLYHSAFEVDSAEELSMTIERLEQLGAEFALVDHGISWAVYTSDPDGNGVEVYLDRRKMSGGVERWNGQSRRLKRQEIEATRG